MKQYEILKNAIFIENIRKIENAYYQNKETNS